MRHAIVIAVLAALCVPALGQAKPNAKPKVDDIAVAQAIEKGKAWLFSTQQADGSWENFSPEYEMGSTIMATYALLECGVDPQDDHIKKAIDWLNAKADERLKDLENPAKGSGTQGKPCKTYELGLLCQVYLAANVSTKNKYLDNLKKVSDALIKYSNRGGYAYDVTKPADPKNPPTGFDNSNSQYGVLGAWAAAIATNEVPKEYWYTVMRHWLNTQCQDGGWQYQDVQIGSSPTMTAAGVASMFVCYDGLFAQTQLTCSSQDDFRPIQRGLDWLEKNFESGLGEDIHYYLYGIERVGLASGYKYFGATNWYQAGAERLVPAQNADGSWQGRWKPHVSTCFSLLFLQRGRNSVLFNKLEYSGDWNNRSRDLAMACRDMTRRLDNNTVNWQIVNLRAPVSDWHDAPILYIAGSKEPKFTPAEINKLREYVNEGGTILFMTECVGAPFSKGVKDLCAKLFPQYKYEALPVDHELIAGGPPNNLLPLKGKVVFNMVSNGVRPLIIHSETDLAQKWQKQEWKDVAFDALSNVSLYVTSKKEGLRPRGVTLWPEMTTEALVQTVKIARVEHKANCDPEPMALERFKLLMANYNKTKVDLLGTMGAGKLVDSGAQVAVITGTEKLTLTGEEKEALKKFVANGGKLVIDAAGGSKEFAASARNLVEDMFGQTQQLASQAAVFQLKGLEIDKFRYRMKNRMNLGKEPKLRAILDNDQPTVYVSSQDLTAGLLGCTSLGIEGYDVGKPDGKTELERLGTAFAIMRNIVLSAAPNPGVASQPTSEPATSTAPAPAEAGK